MNRIQRIFKSMMKHSDYYRKGWTDNEVIEAIAYWEKMEIYEVNDLVWA